jgi:fumarylpyruvate hydrolase
VRRIFCVARNYAAHAREMGVDPDRTLPAFFTKPADALVINGEPVPYPPATANLHHEGELVVGIGRAGRAVSSAEALGHVVGYAVGIDLTRRDLQNEAKRNGQPWDMSKGFDHSAPCGPLNLVEQVGHPTRGRIWLTVGGAVRQEGDLRDMLWNVAEVLSVLSRQVTIQPGDLVFTGTPPGVGPVVPGDTIEAGVDGLIGVSCTIVSP